MSRAASSWAGRRWPVSDWVAHGVIVSSAPWGCGAAGSAPRSQRGGQGFESPQLHRYIRRSEALSRSGMRAFAVSGAKVQQQSTAAKSLSDDMSCLLMLLSPAQRPLAASSLVVRDEEAAGSNPVTPTSVPAGQRPPPEMVRASLAASTAAKYSSRPFLLLRRCGLKGARVKRVTAEGALGDGPELDELADFGSSVIPGRRTPRSERPLRC